MNGLRVVVHQSSSRIGNSKFAAMTAASSVAVVEEIAPMCRIASSLRPSSQRNSSLGETIPE
jgi:hypothetical protein